MREPRAKLHRPVEALRRLQTLVGMAKGVAMNDRDENRSARTRSILEEAFSVAFAALNGGPLPPPRDHERAI